MFLQQEKYGKLLHFLIRIYQVIVVLSMIGSLTRTAFVMVHDDTYSMLTYVTNALYQFTCLTNCLISWKAFSDRFGHQRNMLKYINEIILPMFENAGIFLDNKALRKKQVIVTIICSVLMLIGPFTWIINFYVLLPPPEVIRENNITLTITLPIQDSYASRLAILLPGIACDIGLVFVSFYLVTISLILMTIFSSYNKTFKQQLSEDRTKCIDNLERWRGIHVKLCETIEGFDNDLGYFYANIHLWILLLSIVVLYYLVRVPVPFLGIILQLYYLSLCLGLLFTVAIYAASVHQQAHKPLSYIYNMEIQRMDSTNLSQLTMFLSKLTGSQTGFTTCGLLLITKEFIVSAHKPLSYIYNMEIQRMDSTNLSQLTMFLSKLTGSQTGFTTCGLLLITKEFIVSIVGAFVTYFAVLYTL